jgi:hypothetical protein
LSAFCRIFILPTISERKHLIQTLHGQAEQDIDDYLDEERQNDDDMDIDRDDIDSDGDSFATSDTSSSSSSSNSSSSSESSGSASDESMPLDDISDDDEDKLRQNLRQKSSRNLNFETP